VSLPNLRQYTKSCEFQGKSLFKLFGIKMFRLSESTAYTYGRQKAVKYLTATQASDKFARGVEGFGLKL
jgi:hypothetical protein